MKAGKTIVLVVLVAGLLAAPASASMYVDINPASGPTAIAIDSPTALVSGMQLNARIVSASAPLSLWKLYTSVLSTNVGGGLINGTLSSAWVPGTPLQIYSGASLGTQQNLDTDGDLDIGGTSPGDALSGYMLGQKGTSSSADLVAQTDPAGIPIWTLGFQGTGWAGAATNPHGVTVIQAIPRQKTGVSIWKEGTVLTGNTTIPGTGNTITLYRPDDAILDKTTLDIKLGGPGTLDASNSTGSIDEWQWDVNGDGQYELKKAGATSMTFSVDLAGLVSWHDNVGDSGTWQATKAQQAGALVPIGLRTKYGNDASPLASDTTMATLLLPEPATMALLGLGGLALAIRRRRAA